MSRNPVSVRRSPHTASSMRMHRTAEMIALDQSPVADPSADTNNNTPTKKNEKYSLRQRQKRDSQRHAGTQNTTGASVPAVRGVREKTKSKAAPLSKYRRKTANARERTRMREINTAFESLRQCVPNSMAGAAQPCTSASNEKLTKITTLRLAMKYIRTLSECLSRSASSDSSLLVNNNSLSINNNAKPEEVDMVERVKMTQRTNQCAKEQRLKKDLSPCLTPPMDDSPADLGLILESDGESLQLSEPCLSPLGQSMKPFHCTPTESLELGLFLESDSESLQLSEPCLSPLGHLDPFADDWIHSGFSEHSALDIYLT